MKAPSASNLATAVRHHRFVLATLAFFFGLAVLVEGGGSQRASTAAPRTALIRPVGHTDVPAGAVPAPSSEPMGPPTASGFDVVGAPDFIDPPPPSSTTTSTTTTTTTTIPSLPPEEPSCDDEVPPEVQEAIEAFAALFGVSVPEDDSGDKCDTTTPESTTSSAWG